MTDARRFAALACLAALAIARPASLPAQTAISASNAAQIERPIDFAARPDGTRIRKGGCCSATANHG